MIDARRDEAAAIALFHRVSHLANGKQSLTCSSDVSSITKSFVNHVHTSLARQAYNLDDLGAYQAAALSVRDNLIVRPAYIPSFHTS